MALQMVRPTKHPKTGVYRIRMGVPEALRPAAKELFGSGRELIENLRTKDPREARAAAGSAVAKLEQKLAAIRAACEGRPPELPEQAVQALAGRYYQGQMERWGADPGPVGRWEGEQFGILDGADQGPIDDRLPMDEDNRELKPVAGEDDLQTAKGLLKDAGYVPTASAIERVALAVVLARFQFARAMERRALGDWREDKTALEFPPLPARVGRQIEPPRQVTGPTVDDLVESWARDQGWVVDAKPVPRPLYDRQRTMARLVAFVGHRDAARITKADAVRWKEAMQGRKLSVLSVRNDLSEMSAVWKQAIRNGKLPEGSNPFDGISPPKPKSRKPERRSFTNEEAAAILTAARSNNGYMRWVPWVCALTGARISEVCQASRQDITEVDGVMVLRVHDEGGDDDEVHSIKNEDSRRNIPIHPALVAEGFLDYVARLPQGGPLFPDAKPDALFGRRGTNASKNLSRWLKAELQITDPKISPSHSWRHWFTEACRRTRMHPEVRSALTGHSARLDESAGYGAGAGSFVGLLAEAIAKIEPPIPPLARP